MTSHRAPPPLRLTRRGKIVVWTLAISGPLLLLRAVWPSADGPAVGDLLTATEGPTPQVVVAATWAVPEDGFLLDDEGEPAGLSLVQRAPVVVAGSAEDPAAVWLAGRLQAPLVDALTDDADLPASWGTRVVVDTAGRLSPADVEVSRIPWATTPTPSDGETTAEAAPRLDDLADVRAALETTPEIDLGPVRDLLDAAPEPRDERPFTALVRPSATAATLVPLLLAGAAVEQTTATDLFTEDTELLDGLRGPAVQAGTAEDWGDVDPEVWTWQRAVVANGVELPGGGYRVFPGDRRYIAVYGSPESGALGVLGEQGTDETVTRAQDLAADYEDLDALIPIPAYDLIATVASANEEPTGDYSRRVPHDVIRAAVDAAGAAGIYVVLDLQSGRTDFLTQAMEIEEFLLEPHVGLALDPEWRLGPDQVHLVQIGTVDVAEVNATGEWLATLTRENGLPEKMFLVHQFTRNMFTGKADFADFPELAEIVQMDGQGTQSGKLSTWEAITQVDLPAHVVLGWKNFYDEDPETRSPADTVALDPTPVFVSYQ